MSGDSGAREKRWGDTTSKTGEKSRVFVGNTDPKKTVCSDLEAIFHQYGQIDGIDIHNNGFAFVQFARIDEAQRACQGENGVMLHGKKIEVRLFDKANPKKKERRDRSRSPMRRGHPPGPAYDQYGPPPPGQYGEPPIPYGEPAAPPPAPPTNDAEIIVMHKDQWAFGEMIEKKLRHETGIQFVDLLFLHSPEHINMTLNDLFQRRTLYALVISPLNEEQNTITVHILHNQTERPNIPVHEAIAMINRDHRAYTGRDRNGQHGPPPPVPSLGDRGAKAETDYRINLNDGNYPRSGINSSFGAGSAPPSVEKRLPDDISYVLRTTLSEGGCQFLSLQQIDSVIEYFTKERERLTSAARPVQSTPFQQSSYDSYQSVNAVKQNQPGNSVTGNAQSNASNLLDNPQVKAALSSLFQLGAMSSSGSANGAGIPQSREDGSNYSSVSYQYASGEPMAGVRRHPLMGTELGAGRSQPAQRGFQNRF
ncbi:Heterogeneous nuclear ribonucleoprotein C-like 1 [Halotydeus destructor]|nr:Heterogeneous nuclear ribonucleoprotein C-like 1 [Halotydeus destructor]